MGNFYTFPGCIIDAVLTSNGRYFVTAELDLVQIWNLPAKVVLYKDSQADLIQLVMVEIGTGIVVAFSCDVSKKGTDAMCFR